MSGKRTIIDLTHALKPSIPTWDGSCGFRATVTTDYSQCTPPNLFRVQKIDCNAGIGTHIDAPAHVIPNGRTIEQLSLEELCTECVVIDVSKEAHDSYVVMPSTVEKFEREFGAIQRGSFVIFYTGWDARWDSPAQYHNDHRFPSIDPSTADFLLKRDVGGIGTDTLSVDRGDSGFPVHRLILGADKFLIENVAQAKLLPPVGTKVMALPTKIEGGTEAPIRLVAMC